ncbi:MAG TPA: alkaline phosphatase family protein [Terracidiphilus sp.]|nr:alkaline phosphatase family protein [Terracidiphilus sp.]
MSTPIERLVVLMLENRSFDHLLGFLKRDNAAINGLTGTETNPPADDSRPQVQVSDLAGDVGDLDPDPGHDFNDVTIQIFGSLDTAQPADMSGFVGDYARISNNPIHGENIMRCFKPQTLPVLSTLAQQYGVCDRWFSSVPGSTIPNRMFVHGASSAGSVTQDAIVAPFLLHTIFESFGPNTIHTYKIYTSGSSILLANKYQVQHQAKFADYSQFESDALNGNLPAYTFIEPRYDDDDAGNFANSQHPDFPVDRGEGLIADVYNILTKSPRWKSTLLLILYDEHGGIYDHVVPPSVQCSPENAHLPVPSSGPPFNFDFSRLGVRVPAVFVSPCIPAGTVINDRDYEHSSVVATVRKLFCPDTAPLTWREAQAATFENVLSLEGSDIRNDVVNLPPPVVSPGVVDISAAEEHRSPTDLSALIARAMHYSLQQRGIASPVDPSTLTTASQVAAYLRQANQLSLNPPGAQP